MPLPNPKDGESQNDFMSRCMEDAIMQSEYPNKQQRLAVCYTTWRDAKTNNSAG